MKIKYTSQDTIPAVIYEHKSNKYNNIALIQPLNTSNEEMKVIFAFFFPEYEILEINSIFNINRQNESIEFNKINFFYNIKNLTSINNKNPKIYIIQDVAMAEYLPNLEDIKQKICSVSVGQKMDLNHLIQSLVKIGYARQQSSIREFSELSVKGDILDIGCVNEELGLRINFSYDSIEKLHFFNLQTQENIKSIDEYHIMPIRVYLEDENIKQAAIIEINSRLSKEKNQEKIEFFNTIKHDIKNSIHNESTNYLAKLFYQNSYHVGHIFENNNIQVYHLESVENSIKDYIAYINTRKSTFTSVEDCIKMNFIFENKKYISLDNYLL